MSPEPSERAVPLRDRVSLRSILALAGSAGVSLAAVPAEADIIVSPVDLTHATYTVGFGGGQHTSLSITLPGDGGVLGFRTWRSVRNSSSGGSTKSTTSWWAVQGAMGAFGRFAIQPRSRTLTNPGSTMAFRTALNTGVDWNNFKQAGWTTASERYANVLLQSVRRQYSRTPTSSNWTVQNSNASLLGAGAFATNKYLLFRFIPDATQPTRYDYGWVEMTTGTAQSNPDRLSVTFTRWAYDDTGAVIGAGQTQSAAVPELDPQGMAGVATLVAGAFGLLERRRRRAGEAMGGALVEGARALRRWRRERAAAGPIGG